MSILFIILVGCGMCGATAGGIKLGEMYDKWLYEHCPGRDRCCFDTCMKDSLYGCPVVPHGEFLTEEEIKELRKKIEELD